MERNECLQIPKGAIFVVGIVEQKYDEKKKINLPGGAWQVYFNSENGLNHIVNLQYKDTKKGEMDKSINDFYRKNLKCFMDHAEWQVRGV